MVVESFLAGLASFGHQLCHFLLKTVVFKLAVKLFCKTKHPRAHVINSVITYPPISAALVDKGGSWLQWTSTQDDPPNPDGSGVFFKIYHNAASNFATAEFRVDKHALNFTN